MHYFLLIAFVLSAASYGQIKYATVFQSDYQSFPCKPRTDNSGIYCIDGFSASDSGITFLEHDSGAMHFFRSGSSVSDAIAPANKWEAALAYDKMKNHPLVSAVAFEGTAKQTMKYISDGVYQTGSSLRIALTRESNSLLLLELSSQSRTELFRYPFPGNLSCVDLIGTDKHGSLFVLCELYKKDFPFSVEREIKIISTEGIIIKSFRVPLRKYVAVTKEFETDADGNVLQLLSDERGIRVIRWRTAGFPAGISSSLPPEFMEPLHYNQFTPKRDPAVHGGLPSELAIVERTTALKTGETYVQYRYSCTAANLASAAILAPDGDSVQTPPRLSAGMNAEVGYKWGGFNTLSGYATGLAGGKYAGDIHCDQESNYAVGVDCSGFLSRCWQLSSHVTTANLPGITTTLASWDSLKPADAILRTGHVRMFIERTSTGSFRVVESSGRDWGVSYWTYSTSDLAEYHPCAYNNISSKSFARIPVMKRVLVISANTIRLTWSCDTASVEGYRLYKSTNGSTWSLIMNEAALKTQSVDIPLTDSIAYFRVSCVKNDVPNYSEGFWSNVLGYANYYSPKKNLLVQGFTRTGGSWRSTVEECAIRYGKAFESMRKKFESARNSELLTGIDLRAYDAVFWILGDESTANATFSDSEQPLVKQYLEAGGSLFVSGSEVGYDLYAQGSSADKSFFNNYLKAVYLADDASAEYVSGTAGKALQNCAFYFGQTYAVNYPDEINVNGGSEACATYSNGKVAGIQYTGAFGSSQMTGRLIYLAFPLETTADDTAMNRVMRQASAYLGNGGNCSIKIIPQGFLDTLTNSLASGDTVRIYLAQTTQPHTFIDSANIILDSLKFTAQGLFRNAASGNYYIVARHRNSIETWSKAGGEAYAKDGILSYDFTSSAARAYGNNLMSKGGYYCIYSGDVNQDGIIDFSDLIAVDNASNVFASGYVATDITGDLFVDFSDLSITDNNSFNFIAVMKPGSVKKAPTLPHHTE